MAKLRFIGLPRKWAAKFGTKRVIGSAFFDLVIRATFFLYWPNRWSNRRLAEKNNRGLDGSANNSAIGRFVWQISWAESTGTPAPAKESNAQINFFCRNAFTKSSNLLKNPCSNQMYPSNVYAIEQGPSRHPWRVTSLPLCTCCSLLCSAGFVKRVRHQIEKTQIFNLNW